MPIWFLKAIAAIGSGSLTTGVVWVIVAVAHLDVLSAAGVAVVGLVGSAATWLVAKAVAALRAAPAPVV